MKKRYTKAEKLAFAQGCRVGARNANKTARRRTSSVRRVRRRSY